VKFAYIYKITNIKNERCYIGFTTNPDIRWEQHQNCTENSSSLLHKSMMLEGASQFKFQILYKSQNLNHTLFTMESYFIGLHKSHVSLGGYNLTYGGDHPYLINEVAVSEANANEVAVNEFENSVLKNKYFPLIKLSESPYKNRVLNLIKHLSTGNCKFILADSTQVVKFESQLEFASYIKSKNYNYNKIKKNLKLLRKIHCPTWDNLRSIHSKGVFAIEIYNKKQFQV